MQDYNIVVTLKIISPSLMVSTIIAAVGQEVSGLPGPETFFGAFMIIVLLTHLVWWVDLKVRASKLEKATRKALTEISKGTLAPNSQSWDFVFSLMNQGLVDLDYSTTPAQPFLTSLGKTWI